MTREIGWWDGGSKRDRKATEHDEKFEDFHALLEKDLSSETFAV